MAIKAIFPPGVTALTVNGLHQWDYGCKLEIHADDLPGAFVEVHFACAGMDYAVVRGCNVTAGVAEAAIPDRCLEQTAPIHAWIYEVGTTTGTTTKTIILPIIARTRPQTPATDPEVYSDQYTEAVSEINKQVNALKAGNVKVSKAIRADEAGRADRADIADIADLANDATSAQFAEVAGKANILSNEGWIFINDYKPLTAIDGAGIANCTLEPTATYIFCISDYATGSSGTMLLTCESERRSNSSKTTLSIGYVDGNPGDYVDVSLRYDQVDKILSIDAIIVTTPDISENTGMRVSKDFRVCVAYKRIA